MSSHMPRLWGIEWIFFMSEFLMLTMQMERTLFTSITIYKHVLILSGSCFPSDHLLSGRYLYIYACVLGS